MVDALERETAPVASQAEDEAAAVAPRGQVPSWLITTGSVVFVLLVEGIDRAPYLPASAFTPGDTTTSSFSSFLALAAAII